MKSKLLLLFIFFLELKNPSCFVELCNIITQNIVSVAGMSRAYCNNICACFMPCT